MTTENREGTSRFQLRLPNRLGKELQSLARTAYPYEACGLIIGDSGHDAVSAVRITQATNMNQENPHDRYLLDSADFVAADRAARYDGLEIVGIWHTHPDSSAVPSVTDLEGAWTEYSYLIVAISSNGETNTRSWRLDGKCFAEEIIRGDDL